MSRKTAKLVEVSRKSGGESDEINVRRLWFGIGVRECPMQKQDVYQIVFIDRRKRTNGKMNEWMMKLIIPGKQKFATELIPDHCQNQFKINLQEVDQILLSLNDNKMEG